MKIRLNGLSPGTYILAVSGGVDSVVLLDLLAKLQNSKMKIVVAHCDHGIRTDSEEDAKFVAELARDYGLFFELGTAKLGPNASELVAREARYKFLRSVASKHKADAIITAHHQDDIVETMIINLLRGTSWRGLAPMQNTPDIIRPLLEYPKSELIEYAKTNNLQWHEDYSNQDTRYLRNYVRHNIIPKLGKSRSDLLRTYEDMKELVPKIDLETSEIEKNIFGNSSLDRNKFISLPHNIAELIIKRWLEREQVKNIDAKLLNRVVIALKTLKINKKFSIDKNKLLQINADLSVTIVSS